MRTRMVYIWVYMCNSVCVRVNPCMHARLHVQAHIHAHPLTCIHKDNRLCQSQCDCGVDKYLCNNLWSCPLMQPPLPVGRCTKETIAKCLSQNSRLPRCLYGGNEHKQDCVIDLCNSIRETLFSRTVPDAFSVFNTNLLMATAAKVNAKMSRTKGHNIKKHSSLC